MEEIVNERKKNSNLIYYILIGVITVVILIYMTFIYIMTPNSRSVKTMTVTITEGSKTKNVLQAIEDVDLIKSAKIAGIYAKLTKQDEFKVGTYEIPLNTNAKKVVEYFANGKVEVEK